MKSPSVQLLLVEEDELFADLTAFRLEMFGYSVRWARTVRMASECLSADPLPALIVVDASTVGDDGLAIIASWTIDDRSRSIPILALSHRSDRETIFAIQLAGADDFLQLPYDPLDLERKLRSLIEQSQHASLESCRGRGTKSGMSLGAVAN